MLNKESFKELLTYALVVGLFILAGMIVLPVLSSIIYGILLAYIFYPVYLWTLSKLKNENFSAFLVCLIVLGIIVGIGIIIISSLLRQVVNFYLTLQNTDYILVLKEILPAFLSSSESSTTIVTAINASVSNLIQIYLAKVSNFILDVPIILLQLFVVIFVFFFALRDGVKALAYIKTLSPLKKETHNKFFVHMKDITNSVLLGQILVGVLQGVFAGIGYFIFGVPNALLLTFLTVIVGVIPLIGPWLIWIPVDIYLFAVGRNGSGIGLLIYGMILINWVDAFIRPLIVSKRAKINIAVVIIGMIGGMFTFGVLGLILGPLILAYILLAMELYRKRDIDSGDSLLFRDGK